MSKVDAMRALREARMSAQAKAAPAAARPATGTPATKPATRTAAAARPVAAAPATEVPAEAVERCGHRNMGGKSCTRDAGHSEKNHRYG